MHSIRMSLLAYLGVVTALVYVMIATAPAVAKEAPTPPYVPVPVVVELTPKEYLYANYPKEAPLMDAIIACESGWHPGSKNITSTASGLAQFLASTWRHSRAAMGKEQDLDLRFDPEENIDTAVWLLRNAGPTQWECYTLKML